MARRRALSMEPTTLSQTSGTKAFPSFSPVSPECERVMGKRVLAIESSDSRAFVCDIDVHGRMRLFIYYKFNF